jgi:hypothetical protein
MTRECTESVSRDEAYNWVFVLTSLISTLVYLGILIPGMIGTPISDVSYVAPFLWVLGSALVVGFGAVVVIRAAWPKESRFRDERDKEIDLIGQYVGSSMVTIGGMAALTLSIVDADRFWVSNSLIVGFLFAAVFSSFSRAAAYRGEYPEL